MHISSFINFLVISNVGLEKNVTIKLLPANCPYLIMSRGNSKLQMQGELTWLSKYALEYKKWEKHMDEVRELHLELSMVHGKQKVDIEFEEFEEKFENKGKGYAK